MAKLGRLLVATPNRTTKNILPSLARKRPTIFESVPVATIQDDRTKNILAKNIAAPSLVLADATAPTKRAWEGTPFWSDSAIPTIGAQGPPSLQKVNHHITCSCYYPSADQNGDCRDSRIGTSRCSPRIRAVTGFQNPPQPSIPPVHSIHGAD